jgi:putative flippase GtrA
MLQELIKKYQAIAYQFLRFAGIGFLNTAVDFSVINILIATTGAAAGLGLSLLKVVSFSIAVFHSYFWNKYWAFSETNEKILRFILRVGSVGLCGLFVIAAAIYGASQNYAVMYFIMLAVVLVVGELVIWQAFKLRIAAGQAVAKQQFGLSILVSITGAILNAAIVGLVTRFIAPPFGMNAHLWANIANAMAVAIALFWNFVGYKIFVFKK